MGGLLRPGVRPFGPHLADLAFVGRTPRRKPSNTPEKT